jgi:predicted dehydrogenase
MNVGFGIVGCGMIAEFHAGAIAAIPDARLVGCHSRSPESAARFAETHGVRSFTSLEEILDSDEIDVICICTPSGNHLEPALSAACAGKHLVIEKPLEVTPQRCDRIIEACSANKVLLTTIFQSRFHEAARAMHEAVQTGRFGQLSLGSASVKWFRTQAYYDSAAWRGTWALDGGGALMNQAIHNVDLLQWMMGPVVEVSAFSATLAHQRIEVEDTITAILRFENGAMGTIEATTAAWPGWLKRLEICGVAGSAILEDDTITRWDFAVSRPGDERMTRPCSTGDGLTGGATDPSAIGWEGHRQQLRDFLTAIRTGSAPYLDGEEAKKSVSIISAIYQSAREGKAVRMVSA